MSAPSATISTRLSPIKLAAGATAVVEADIHDGARLRATIREHRVNAVMHFAAWLSVSDSVRAVDGVTIDVGEREFFVLLGLSGSGKTTLLRCVAGLEKPEGGEIAINHVLVSSAERNRLK